LSFHSFDPFSAGRARVKWLTEVLRLTHDLSAGEFHDADHVERLVVLGQNQLADPQSAATQDGGLVPFYMLLMTWRGRWLLRVVLRTGGAGAGVVRGQMTGHWRVHHVCYIAHRG
jgi:hypothetical protein